MCKKSFYLAPVAFILAMSLANMAKAELIAHWPLDGNYKDATGNGHDGAPLGDPEFVLDVEKELVLEVDGDDRVMVEDAPDLNYTANESLTMTAWALYDPALASGGWRCIAGKGRTAPGGRKRGVSPSAKGLMPSWKRHSPATSLQGSMTRAKPSSIG